MGSTPADGRRLAAAQTINAELLCGLPARLWSVRASMLCCCLDGPCVVPICHSVAGDADLVTETDKACEALVLGRIRAAFPDHKFIGEEGSAAQASRLPLYGRLCRALPPRCHAARLLAEGCPRFPLLAHMWLQGFVDAAIEPPC